MILECKNMLTFALDHYSGRLPGVNLESKSQGEEYRAACDQEKFYNLVSSLNTSFEEIVTTSEHITLEVNSNKIQEDSIRFRKGKESKIVLEFSHSERALAECVRISQASAQSVNCNKENASEATFTQEREGKNFTVLTAGSTELDTSFKVVGDGSNAWSGNLPLHKGVTFEDEDVGSVSYFPSSDKHVLIQNEEVLQSGTLTSIALPAQHESEIHISIRPNNTNRVPFDKEQLNKFLPSVLEADSSHKDSFSSIKIDCKALREGSATGPASSSSNLVFSDKVDAVLNQLQRVSSPLQDSFDMSITSDLDDHNATGSAFPKLGGDKVIEGFIASKIYDGETMDTSRQVVSNLQFYQSPKVGSDQSNPILIISVEDNNVAQDIKFASSSHELIDLMVQKQNYLRMAFKNYDIEGYNFSFQDRSRQDQSKQEPINEAPLSEDGLYTHDEQVNIELSLTSGIDKRI